MLRYISWGLWIIVLTVVVAFLHYTLPQRDIVYITNTSNRLMTFGSNSIFWASPDAGSNETAGALQRDVLFIDAVRPNGNVIVYRNEDTGWIWPPFFKFDSSNLQAEARNLISTAEAPRWVAMRHYGWRVPIMSIFPNAISVTPVAGPDVRLIPWFNIIFLTFLFALYWAIRVRWIRFRNKRIKPALMGIDAAVDDKSASMSRWFGSWRAKPKG
jgi:hypothetical protein